MRKRGGADQSGVCRTCNLARCACGSGRTVVSVGADSQHKAEAMAEAYLLRRGWAGTLVGWRQKRVRLGIMGYKAWDLQYEVHRV